MYLISCSLSTYMEAWPHWSQWPAPCRSTPTKGDAFSSFFKSVIKKMPSTAVIQYGRESYFSIVILHITHSLTSPFPPLAPKSSYFSCWHNQTTIFIILVPYWVVYRGSLFLNSFFLVIFLINSSCYLLQSFTCRQDSGSPERHFPQTNEWSVFTYIWARPRSQNTYICAPKVLMVRFNLPRNHHLSTVYSLKQDASK